MERDLEIKDCKPNISIFHVKEKDYKKDKDAVVKECLTFLLDK